MRGACGEESILSDGRMENKVEIVGCKYGLFKRGNLRGAYGTAFPGKRNLLPISSFNNIKSYLEVETLL